MPLTPLEIAQIAEIVADQVVERLTASADGDVWLDKHGAAKLLGCSVSSIERGTRAGEIPSNKFRGLRRYLRSKLLALSEARTHGK